MQQQHSEKRKAADREEELAKIKVKVKVEEAAAAEDEVQIVAAKKRVCVSPTSVVASSAVFVIDLTGDN